MAKICEKIEDSVESRDTICRLRHYTKFGLYSFLKAKRILAMVILCVCMYVGMYLAINSAFYFQFSKMQTFHWNSFPFHIQGFIEWNWGVILVNTVYKGTVASTCMAPQQKKIKTWGTQATKAWIEQLPEYQASDSDGSGSNPAVAQHFPSNIPVRCFIY